MKITIILTFGIISLISCSTSMKESNEQLENASMGVSDVPNTDNEDHQVGNEDAKLAENRKIIWTANLRFQVADVNISTKSLQHICKQYGGFISSMNLTSTNYQIANSVQMRISNDKFENLIDEIKKEAIYVDEIKIHSNDVTEEFIDIQSRLKTKKEVRDRYIAILNTKTGNVKDIIAAEEAIRKITEEIEAKEGRLRYLKDKVNFSTIAITMYQKVEFKPEPEIYEKPYVKKLIEGLNNGWSIITSFVLLLSNIWPIVLLAGLLLWKRKWIIGKTKK